MHDTIVFRRGDLVRVIDRGDDDREQLGLVQAVTDSGATLLVFQGNGLRVAARRDDCVPVPLSDGPGAAINDFAEVMMDNDPFGTLVRDSPHEDGVVRARILGVYTWLRPRPLKEDPDDAD